MAFGDQKPDGSETKSSERPSVREATLLSAFVFYPTKFVRLSDDFAP